MSTISPVSYWTHYYVPPITETIFKDLHLPPQPAVLKPTKQVIDEFRSAMRSQPGYWHKGTVVDIYV
tara:strand:- start:112 stop:312 length:201 start_codon:yes stop_codon:yes gene_type:complete